MADGRKTILTIKINIKWQFKQNLAKNKTY